MGKAERPAGPDGLVVVDKPAGWTSHDVVAKSRGILGTRKVGHSGTLDPDATGVLLLGVGRATRLLRFLTALGKTYTCEIVLGVETDTLDDSGAVLATHDMAQVTPDAVTVAAAGLTGAITQVPPMVSAVKVDGRRLHELARAGEVVEREARPVTVHRFDVAPTDDPCVYAATVACSSGTYVRTLAADLGTALGGGAHLRRLRRTAVGSFGEDEAHPMEQPTLLAPAEALRDYPAVLVDADVAVEIGHGKVLDLDRLGVPEAVALPRAAGALPAPATAESGPWAVLGRDTGALVAVYERHRGATAKPAVVVAPA